MEGPWRYVVIFNKTRHEIGISTCPGGTQNFRRVPYLKNDEEQLQQYFNCKTPVIIFVDNGHAVIVDETV